MVDFYKGEVIYLNKPYRMSSFGALAFARTRLCRKLGVRKIKIGHAGTLDPLATGVLILCTGKATKRIEEFQSHSKEYTATLQLGATTASHDMEHPVEATYPTEHITKERILQTLQQFTGTIEQIPPEFSACKVGGKPAYKLARKGKEIKLEPKTLVIDEMELTDFDPETMQMSVRVVCSKGTYIRALARDIGEALGSGAYLTALCRTRIGDIHIQDCLTFDDFQPWLDGLEIAPYPQPQPKKSALIPSSEY